MPHIREYHILLISDSDLATSFGRIFSKNGIKVTRVLKESEVFEIAKKTLPDAIMFALPVYWSSVTDFLESIRGYEILERIPVIYLGNVLEGQDQIILKRYGVHTMTLGPVPKEEVVRYILRNILKIENLGKTRR